jgi:hypothetical protein
LWALPSPEAGLIPATAGGAAKKGITKPGLANERKWKKIGENEKMGTGRKSRKWGQTLFPIFNRLLAHH